MAHSINLYFSRAFIHRNISVLVITVMIVSCKEKLEQSKDDFIFLERNGYMIDSYDGVSVYRLESGEIMNGYYVISNKFGKAEEFSVSEGLLNGINLTFHNNNEVYSKANYAKGKKHGEESTYYPSGKLQKATKYSQGVLIGPTISYYESGQVQSETKFKDEKVIESTSFDIIGNITSQSFIKNGRTMTQYISKGVVIREHINSNYDDFDAMKFYDSNGEMVKFLRMYQQGDKAFLIELDEDENELLRINLKDNPEKVLEYRELFSQM